MDLYSGGGGLIIRGETYIWNEVSVSTCGGLIHGLGEAYIREGAYIRRFTVIQLLSPCMLFCYVTVRHTQFDVITWRKNKKWPMSYRGEWITNVPTTLTCVHLQFFIIIFT